MKDVIIIGHGPAGISAALYTCRAKLSTVVIGKDGGSLSRADKIENYFGLATPLSGRELISIGKTQSQALGAELIDGEVLNITQHNPGFGFTVETTAGTYDGKTVILATGAQRKTPKIKGIQEFEGRGVSYCAVCDAFFFRGRDVAVLGNGPYSLHEVQHLQPLVKSVTLLTNGAELMLENEGQEEKLEDEVREGKLTIITDPIKELSGDSQLQTILFKNGKSLVVEGLFVALGSASAVDLARKLGAMTDNNMIMVDKEMLTNIPGVFAAGDCIGGLLQISTAVADGAKAAMSAIEFIRNTVSDEG